MLVVDTADPMTLLCARSTNLSILDTVMLGRFGEVLKSRRVTRIKEGLSVPGFNVSLHLNKAGLQEHEDLEPKTVPFTCDDPFASKEGTELPLMNSSGIGIEISAPII
ncbi:hypothetical protein CRG98_035223 [Punica granatum]|uniref:Uncharacterized protein n=1 Tax=Punica granatum TaxID=22663 RepID=A0A2I0IK68_PUNGR|nr:hypothetical protein CRG98_035223 [Punica granatum]